MEKKLSSCPPPVCLVLENRYAGAAELLQVEPTPTDPTGVAGVKDVLNDGRPAGAHLHCLTALTFMHYLLMEVLFWHQGE